jgi:hypothetical protein
VAALEKDARLARNGLVRPDFGKLRALFRRFASPALRRNQSPGRPMPERKNGSKKNGRNVGKIIEIKGVVLDAVFPDELAGDPARPDFQDLKPSIEIFETGIKVID